IAIFYGGASLSGAFGGLLAYGIVQMQNVGGLPGWRWIFIIEGIATVLLGTLSAYTLPADLESAPFFSEEERRYAVSCHSGGADEPSDHDEKDSVSEDANLQTNHEVFEMREVWRGIFDIQAWLAGIGSLCVTTTVFSYALFLPTILTGLGYSGREAQLRAVPPNVPSAFLTVFVAFMSHRLNVRAPFILALLPLSIAGYAMLIYTKTVEVRYAAAFLVAAGTYPSAATILSILPNNTSGHYKRATVIGLQIALSNIGGFIATSVYTSGEWAFIPLGGDNHRQRANAIMRFLWVTTVLSLGAPAFSKLFQSIADVGNTSYDYVIVGGGTAGSVLASRLTEDGKTKVLVVEAGVDNANVQSIIVPFMGPAAFGTSVDWNFTTNPQSGLFGRTIGLSRGHVLGGSSSINFMTWNRGSDDLWNTFARLSGDDNWSWKSIEKYYRKTSRLTPPQDRHNTTGEVIPSAHGNGPVLTSLPGFPSELDPLVSGTAKDLGQYNQDINAGNMIGFGFIQNSIGNGERSSAATAYLVPALKRPNLDVVINSRTTRLFASQPVKGGQPTINTVQVAQGANGPLFNVTASKEVILSAGVFGTPQLLLLSGIGPKGDLSKLNIPVVVDSPDVGKHLADHPLLANYYQVNSNSTFDDILRNEPASVAPLLEQWEANRTGLLTVPVGGNTIAFLKNPKGFLSGQDPSSGPKSGNVEFIFCNGFEPLGPTPFPQTGSFLTLLTAVVSPTSRGAVTLNSTNPFDDPIIDPQLYSTDFDIQSMVQAMKTADSFVHQPKWKGYIQQPLVQLASDNEKADYARNNSITVNHPVGTARMGPGGVTGGVVDSSLRVKGVKGLRIVDASVFPQIPENHPQSVVYTLAERASDLIKSQH
ncbi:hypothetical protein V5O48_014443, partial [Marasmius crinis-equi]